MVIRVPAEHIRLAAMEAARLGTYRGDYIANAMLRVPPDQMIEIPVGHFLVQYLPLHKGSTT